MSMIDPCAPTYYFTYKKIETSREGYVKSSEGQVFKIKIVEEITRHNPSDREWKKRYLRYEVELERYMEEFPKRILNKIFRKKDKIEKYWIPIKYSFYRGGMYSYYAPRGLVLEGDLYKTEKEAKQNKHSVLFREYNMEED